MLRRLWDQAERRTSKLLSDDSVFALVQRALFTSLLARQSFERQVLRLLYGANIPSQRDVDRLTHDLRDLGESIDGLRARVDRLLAERQTGVAPIRSPVVDRPAKADHE